MRGVRSNRSLFPLTTLWLCAAFSLCAASSLYGGAPSDHADHASPPSVILAGDTTSTEITHPEPIRYAVIHHGSGPQEPGAYRTLHRARDVLFHPEDPTRSFLVVGVTMQSVTLRETSTGQNWVWLPNSPFPGLPSLTLVETVPLDRVEYRLKVVPTIEHPDPIVLSITGSAAVVEKEILPKDVTPPAGSSENTFSNTWPVTKPELARLTRVTQIDEDTYALDADSIKPALDNLGQLLSDLEVMVSPRVSLQTGMGFDVASAAADGVLDQGGFTVTTSKLARLFGIKSGDRILRVNRQPVTSPLDAWRAYQEFFMRDHGRTDLLVDLRRDGSVMTKTYRFR